MFVIIWLFFRPKMVAWLNRMARKQLTILVLFLEHFVILTRTTRNYEFNKESTESFRFLSVLQVF